MGTRKTKDEYIGKCYKNKYGTIFKITSYKKYSKVDCLDITHNIVIKDIDIGNLKKKSINSPLDKTVYDVGYLGIGNCNSKDNKKCYYTWFNMMTRGYSNKYKSKYSTYEFCEVCDEWHNYQNFAEWFNKNYYEIESERIELDKDIISKDNKIYSPNMCVFVPRRINSLFVKNNKTRGKFVIGVDYHNNSFRARCMTLDGSVFLGNYNTEQEAFLVYKIYKEKYIKQVADNYKTKIPKSLYNALYNYQVNEED